MNSDWSHIQKHYEKLTKNIRPELHSPHHEAAAHEAVKNLCTKLHITSVVELGCGVAPLLDVFKSMGAKTTGVSYVQEHNQHEVIRADMHATGLPDASYDLVASRHTLEHSPMPLLLLMEMYRLSKQYALAILPTHTPRMITTWIDHYSVFDQVGWEKLFQVAGWKVRKFEQAPYFLNEFGEYDEEYRWLLEK